MGFPGLLPVPIVVDHGNPPPSPWILLPPRADGCAGRSVATQGSQGCDGAGGPRSEAMHSAASNWHECRVRNGLNDHDPPARPSLMASLAVGDFQRAFFKFGPKARAVPCRRGLNQSREATQAELLFALANARFVHQLGPRPIAACGHVKGP